MENYRELKEQKDLLKGLFDKLCNSTDYLSCIVLTKDKEKTEPTFILAFSEEEDFFRNVKRMNETFGKLLEDMCQEIFDELDGNDYELEFKENLTTEEKVKKIKSDYKKVATGLKKVKRQIEILQDCTAEYFDRVLRCYGKSLLDDDEWKKYI